MKVIYKAWDGTEFDERDVCEKYEYDNPCVMMYNAEGRTSNSDEAFVVLLKHKDDAEKFIELCEAQSTKSDGITEGNWGLYIWDDCKEKYFYASGRVEDALKRYFKD